MLSAVGMGLLGLMATAKAEEPCPDPDQIVLKATTSVAMLKLNDAELVLNEFANHTSRPAAACSTRLEPTTVAKYYQTLGVLTLLQSQDETLGAEVREEKKAASAAAFSAAKRIAPDGWASADFGDGKWYQAYVAAPVIDTEERVKVKLLGLQPNEWVAFDGKLTPPPYAVFTGQHILQVGQPDKPARYAKELATPSGAMVELVVPAVGVPLDQAEPPKIVEGLSPREKRKRLQLASFVSGGTAAVIFGSAVAARELGYEGQHENQFGTQWRNSVNGLTAASIVTGVGAAAVLGASFSIPLD